MKTPGAGKSLNSLGITSVYKAGADNDDIRAGLEKAVPLAAKQMAPFAARFRGADSRETARKIHNFLVTRATYKKDGENQDIQLPSRFNNSKMADCKTYALFTAAILENLRIPYAFVYASYDVNPIPKHVYVVTGNGDIIDAVWTQRGGGKFNTEKPPYYKYYQPMNVRYLAGFDDSPGLGKVSLKKPLQKVKTAVQKTAQKTGAAVKQTAQKTGAAVKNVAQKTAQVSKTVALAPGRGLLLLAVKENYNGLAIGFSRANQGNVKRYWEIAGGKYSELQKAIAEGVKKPAKKSGILQKMASIVKGRKVSGIGCCIHSCDRNKIQGIGVVAETAATVSFVSVVIAMLPIIQQVLSLIPAKTAKESSENSDGTIIRDQPTGGGTVSPEGNVQVDIDNSGYKGPVTYDDRGNPMGTGSGIVTPGTGGGVLDAGGNSSGNYNAGGATPTPAGGGFLANIPMPVKIVGGAVLGYVALKAFKIIK